jgi:hypothetical protein
MEPLYDFEDILQHINRLKAKNRYTEGLSLAEDFFQQSLSGLFYYQRYHRLPLYVCMAFSYIGFIIYVALVLLRDFTSVFLKKTATREDQKFKILAFFGLCYSLLATLGQNVPIHFSLYYLSPFLVWSKVLKVAFGLQMAPHSGLNRAGKVQ